MAPPIEPVSSITNTEVDAVTVAGRAKLVAKIRVQSESPPMLGMAAGSLEAELLSKGRHRENDAQDANDESPHGVNR